MKKQAVPINIKVRPSPRGNNLKIGSVILLLVGIIWLAASFGMETSVYADGLSVNNIGLQDDRRNHILLGGLITLIGAMGFIGSLTASHTGGRNHQSARARPVNVDLTSPTYKTWLIEEYAIEKNPVLGTYICGDQEFPNVDDALKYAQRIDDESINQANKDTAKYEERLQIHRKYAIALVLIIFACIAAYCLYSYLGEERAEKAERQQWLEQYEKEEAVKAKAWEDLRKGLGG